MNNWLLLALICFIIYIPSFDASESYSSSNDRRGGKSGKPRSGGYDTAKRPNGGKVVASGSDYTKDKGNDYRDLIGYISKEINKDQGRKYGQGNDGSYSKRRDDDYNDGYPVYPPPPSYIPFPVPGYGSDGNKGLANDLLWKLHDENGEQDESISALENKAKGLEETVNKLEKTIKWLSHSLEDLINDLECTSNIPPSIGINYYICTTPSGHIEPNCELGEVVALAGPPTHEQEDYLIPADGRQIDDDPALCNQLCQMDFAGCDTSYVGAARRLLSGFTFSSCKVPDLTGKYLVGVGDHPFTSGFYGGTGPKIVTSARRRRFASDGTFDGTSERGFPYWPPLYDSFPPAAGECTGSETLEIPQYGCSSKGKPYGNVQTADS
mmetsp:Transcript_60868/g.54855  ORF Transcript_60868/g.54855 Transcript_60868/m.54855 type:complete len:381 (-) Transcript_60868:19-1161(-)